MYMTLLIKELIEKTDIRVYYVVYLVLIFCLQRFVKAFPPREKLEKTGIRLIQGNSFLLAIQNIIS